MITLWNLFEATLLCLNAVCILNEDRFLSKFGFGLQGEQAGVGFGEIPGQGSVKNQVLHLVRSIRTVMKFPLVFLNILVMTFKLIVG